MGRLASGNEVLELAEECLSKAKSAAELRQAQAVLLPLKYGMSMEKTAELIGVSRGWACQLRRSFVKTGGACFGKGETRGSGRGRSLLSPEEEREFLEPFTGKARTGGILVVNEIRVALEDRLGKKVATATTYNLLRRHGWRKLAPDRRHPGADPAAQDEWKKNSRRHSGKP